jgi:hypothetical protein
MNAHDIGGIILTTILLVALFVLTLPNIMNSNISIAGAVILAFIISLPVWNFTKENF